MQTFQSHGKLLITGEYLVLKGALALAMPTRYGQRMTVSESNGQSAKISWTSINHEGKEWIQAQFDENFQLITERNELSERLEKLLQNRCKPLQ